MLVVLWNALILHARWSGIVRERGVAVLAILGNLVVGWSFVGTNLMGVNGLHSYGFARAGAPIVLASSGMGIPTSPWRPDRILIPLKHWAMYSNGTPERD